MGTTVAGISVALILIPQSLAYAEIAGVPVEVVGIGCGDDTVRPDNTLRVAVSTDADVPGAQVAGEERLDRRHESIFQAGRNRMRTGPNRGFPVRASRQVRNAWLCLRKQSVSPSRT